MRIGLDIMGGDFAPEAVLEGAFDAIDYLSAEEKLVLVGDESLILGRLESEGIDKSIFDILPSTEVIGMGEHPARAFALKKDSSISVGFNALKSAKLDGFCSAGNTGAMLVAASYTVNVIPGVLRPALVTLLPSTDNRQSVILDVGLNPDSKPDVLLQYSTLGSIYAKYVLKIPNPRVGLLNIGEEETKGSLAVKSAHELIKDNSSVNFAGNLEANALFTSEMTDVIVCDGFAGNIVIKQAEAFYDIFKQRGYKDEFFDKLDFENIGGTPIVGINGNVVIGHGVSKRKAIMNMILQTRDVIKADLAQKIIDEL